MKKIIGIISSCLIVLCFLSINISAATYYDEKYYTETCPTTYYASLDTSKTGEAFRRDLSVIISENYKKHSYSYNTTVLQYTDPDPSNNGNIICFYTGQSLKSNVDPYVWNKEHVWAKSHGFPGDSTEPYCDAHHLRPTLVETNSARANSDFADLSNVSGVQSDEFGNKWTSNQFEPRDEVKGDVARMMFYMATRYGFDGTFNLELTQDSTTSKSDNNGKFGNLDTLLQWHYQDPVSREEIYRNNVIFDNYQKNRNPYIDHPEYVDNAYPNEFSNIVDQDKVDNVINSIESLKIGLTLNSKDLIMSIKASYDSLNENEKLLVTNVDKLNASVEAISLLENSSSVESYFINEQTRASLNIVYNSEYVTTDCDIRFGSTISSSAYNASASYGVLVTTNKNIELNAGFTTYSSIEDFTSDTVGVYNVKCNPVRVSLSGNSYVLDDLGEYYQFAWVIDNMENHYDVTMYAVIYMEYDGKLYLGNSTGYSVVDAARYYFNNYEALGLTQVEKQVMFSLAGLGSIGDTNPGDYEGPFWT